MNQPSPDPVCIVGAGSWGTALAIQFARAGHTTRLWGRSLAERAAMQRERSNERYLPGATFPAALSVAEDLPSALATSRDIIVAVPSASFRVALAMIAPMLRARARVAWATKGFELATGKLPHQVALEVLGSRPLAVLSGPTFAKEVGAGLPTALTVGSKDPQFAADLARLLSGPTFRAYTQPDVIGVEVGGAMKNVIAIGAGIADGMGFGANTRVALITRGLSEMVRLGEKLGAQRDTFMGLAGLGDLVLTCTDNLSRNRRFGYALGQGKSASAAAAECNQVIEGVQAARAVHEVAGNLGVDLPICEQVFLVVHEAKQIGVAVRELMARGIGSESS
jgi:glycerol-3-phosphate dehydrogenase (NAD(P)+)